MLFWLRLKTLFKVLVLPPAGPLLLAFISALYMARRPRLARARVSASVASLWLLATPVVSNTVCAWAEHYPPLDIPAAMRGGAQAIVILGGGGQRAYAPEYAGPAADPVLLERLSYAAYLAGKTHLPILVTGFQIEAIAMRDTLLRNFAIRTRWVDDGAYDTFQNAHDAARLLRADGVERVILVTAATHLWRATHEFAATGLTLFPAPVGVRAEHDPSFWRYAPNASALQRSCGAVNELIGEPVRALLAATHLRRQ